MSAWRASQTTAGTRSPCGDWRQESPLIEVATQQGRVDFAAFNPFARVCSCGAALDGLRPRWGAAARWARKYSSPVASDTSSCGLSRASAPRRKARTESRHRIHMLAPR